ncbi:MAG TPA: N-acetylmuramoyl-L-alanine amidase [Segeticoccus sp.]|uniref:N-acetylmuramoyl-L-alanine amidase n=1 Tax=Segeticoccus sp. TaxID=2706531 RepID=UPI002D80781E|nr:N-acetylmuramoyl-L-alanine amidase [Segeticoccus sp.]HET8600885.1 N-acetylmuramoyl-L-alanine amidase [Segeticoccus sp.]
MSERPFASYDLGAEGPGVEAIRERLQTTGDLPAGSVDRPYDEEVADAVRAFQQRRGLNVDGIVGPATWVVLDGSRWHLGDRILHHTPGHLVQGDDVVELQRRLIGLGFGPARVDGIFGADTEQAVNAFQKAMRLDVTGTVGPDTLRTFRDLSRSVTGGTAQALRERELIRKSGHSLAGRTVVIDPGHGGSDRGAGLHVDADVSGPAAAAGAHGAASARGAGDAVGAGQASGAASGAGAVVHRGRSVSNGTLSDEADIVLDIARRIEGRLSAVGVTVLFTRGNKANPSLAERADIANDAGADVLLSLHCNSWEQPAASGVATYYYGTDDGGAGSAMAEHLAGLIQREIVARTGFIDCRSHARSWTLLHRALMPAVLIEAGYVSHPDDAAKLAEPAFRDTVAEAISVALQRMYLVEDDPSTTGVLNLRELREQLRAAAAGPAASHPRH